MARPKVFISSTFYDLKVVRADIESTLNQMQYDTIMNEHGRIPYEKEKRLEESCYKEVEQCDIFVSIVGGKYGATSSVDTNLSISQVEFKAALDLDKQIFVFVDRPVFYEFNTWQRNQSAEIDWVSVDSKKIFEFLKFVYELPKNKPIQPFDLSSDITVFLREQFAGLFQRLLSEQSQGQEYSLVSQLKATAVLLNEAVEKATTPASGSLSELLFANQPLFQELRTLLKVPYRVFFTSKTELDDWLKNRKFSPIEREAWDFDDKMEWSRRGSSRDDIDLLQISTKILDDKDNVRYIPKSEWKDSYITLIENYNQKMFGIADSPVTASDTTI